MRIVAPNASRIILVDHRGKFSSSSNFAGGKKKPKPSVVLSESGDGSTILDLPSMLWGLIRPKTSEERHLLPLPKRMATLTRNLYSCHTHVDALEDYLIKKMPELSPGSLQILSLIHI